MLAAPEDHPIGTMPDPVDAASVADAAASATARRRARTFDPKDPP
jgi:hypothetical protein